MSKENKISTYIENHEECQECMERWMFHLQDLHNDYYVGLSCILQCLSDAQEAGAVPKLPHEWWRECQPLMKL